MKSISFTQKNENTKYVFGTQTTQISLTYWSKDSTRESSRYFELNNIIQYSKMSEIKLDQRELINVYIKKHELVT